MPTFLRSRHGLRSEPPIMTSQGRPYPAFGVHSKLGVMDTAASRYHEFLAVALESARQEILRRAQEKKLPTSLVINQPVVKVRDTEQGIGWEQTHQQIRVSVLNNWNAEVELRDETTWGPIYTFKEQMTGFAELLDQETGLGSRPHSIYPDLSGPEAIRIRYLAPLAIHYIKSLSDLGTPDLELLEKLSEELDALINSSQVVSVAQLVISGIVPSGTFQHRNVTLRELSEHEKGLIWQLRSSTWQPQPNIRSDLIPPMEFSHFMPDAVLVVKHMCPQRPCPHTGVLVNRVALAFFLKDCPLSGSGVLTTGEVPAWATKTHSSGPYPLAEKYLPTRKLVSEDGFRSIIDLAFKIPDFTSLQETTRGIVLYRALRGFGAKWNESAFLDFAIALEGALLSGIRNELSYRFSLYGALFLQDELDPRETFKRLKNIYEVRSSLVHGSQVVEPDRKLAESDAADLTKRILLRSIEMGWPNWKDLNERALSFGPES